MDVTHATIRLIPAAFLYGFPFTVPERDSGHVFTPAPVAYPYSFVIHCLPPLLDARKIELLPPE